MVIQEGRIDQGPGWQRYASSAKVSGLSNIGGSASRMDKPEQPASLGPSFDYLARQEPEFLPPGRSTPPTKKSAVVATMRDEGLVILEWVAHYRVLGFDTIFIYTNDNTDGSDDLLLALHRAGVITWTQNVVPEELSPQMKAYRHAFWHSAAVWEHDWVAFLDADEFLIPLLNGAIVSVGDYVAHLEELGASSISLNWRWFSGDGEFAPKAGLLPERYRKALPDYHVKSLFRLRDAASISIHHAEMVSGLTLNGNGQPRVSRQHQEPPAYMLGHVNHYWNRSFQEYYIKQRRGRGSSDRALRDISAFFLWGQTGDTRLEPHPGPEHIVRMHAEIENLRSLPGVAAADRAVRDAFLRKVESPHVRTLYDEGKLKPESVS